LAEDISLGDMAAMSI